MPQLKFTDIPSELFVHSILIHLKSKDLIRLTGVCKQFSSLVNNLEINSINFWSDKAEPFYTWCKNSKLSTTVNVLYGKGPIEFDRIDKLVNLHSIILTQSTVLQPSIEKLQNLTKLVLNDCKLVDGDCKYINNISKLKYLQLSNNTISGKGVEQLKLQNLTVLDLSNTSITNTTSLKNLTKLQTLNLKGVVNTINLNYLERIPSLQSLNLSNLDRPFTHVMNFLTKINIPFIPNLTCLDLSFNTQLEDVKGISKLKKLKVLILHDNSLNDKSISEIFQSDYPEMETLNCYNNQLGNNSVSCITTNAPNLTVLSLGKNVQISKEGVNLISNHLTKLTDLNLFGCSLDRQDVENVKSIQVFPSLTRWRL